MASLRNFIDCHFAWLIILAWLAIIFFAPHDGDVGGWVSLNGH